MRTFFGIVIILLTSCAFWLTHLWFVTRNRDTESLKNGSTKDITSDEQLNAVSNIHLPDPIP